MLQLEEVGNTFLVEIAFFFTYWAKKDRDYETLYVWHHPVDEIGKHRK